MRSAKSWVAPMENWAPVWVMGNVDRRSDALSGWSFLQTGREVFSVRKRLGEGGQKGFPSLGRAQQGFQPNSDYGCRHSSFLLGSQQDGEQKRAYQTLAGSPPLTFSVLCHPHSEQAFPSYLIRSRNILRQEPVGVPHWCPRRFLIQSSRQSKLTLTISNKKKKSFCGEWGSRILGKCISSQVLCPWAILPEERLFLEIN